MASDLPAGVTRVVRSGRWIGYRVFQWVPWPGYPKGRVRSKRFPKTATFTELQYWQEERRVEARRRQAETRPPTGEGFLADADRYLETVAAMPQFSQRRRHIQLWAELFGDRQRASVTSADIRAQRDRWLTVGPRRVLEKRNGNPARWIEQAVPLSPQEVNLRLRALENLWTVLDGPSADNPVRDVPECDTPPPRPRGQSFALAREILSYMPDITRPTKGGSPERGSLSRIRFEAMLVTGLPPKQLAALQPEHIDPHVPAFTPPPRRKGRTSRRRPRPRKAPKPRPLMACALPVLERFFALGANRPFSRQSLNRSVRRAIAAANQVRTKRRLPLIDPTLRVYDLTRHTFGTEAYRAYRDLKVVQELMGHSDIKLTEMYAKAAVQEHVLAAVGELDKVARPAGPRRSLRDPVSTRWGGKVGGKVSPPSRPARDRSRRNRGWRNVQ